MSHLLPARRKQPQGGKDSPVVPVDSSSPMFIDETERFKRDAAVVERQQRQANLNKQAERLDSKRAANNYREGHRQHEMQVMEQREQQSLQERREAGTGNRRNQSLQQYDVFTLDYKPTPGGTQLRHQDEVKAEQQSARAKVIYSKVNRQTHNIITGQPLPQ